MIYIIYNWQMIHKETWNVEADHDRMEKITK